MKMKINITRSMAVIAAMALLPVAAFAGGGGSPYDAITDAVDFSDVNSVVAAIAGGLALAFVFIKGAKLGLSLLRG